MSPGFFSPVLMRVEEGERKETFFDFLPRDPTPHSNQRSVGKLKGKFVWLEGGKVFGWETVIDERTGRDLSSNFLKCSRDLVPTLERTQFQDCQTQFNRSSPIRQKQRERQLISQSDSNVKRTLFLRTLHPNHFRGRRGRTFSSFFFFLKETNHTFSSSLPNWNFIWILGLFLCFLQIRIHLLELYMLL